MERLTERHLRAVMAFLRDAYAQPDLDAFARCVVAGLPRLVGGHRVSYNEAHPRLGTLRVLVSPTDDIPVLTSRQYRDHPMLQHFIKTGDGRAHKFSDFLTQEQLHSTEMYQAHYRPAGVEHQVTICVAPPTPRVIAFAIGRDTCDFTERDRLILNMLRPHLGTAYDRSCAAARLHGRMALLARAADAAAGGVVLLSATGRIEFATRQARRWLREYVPRRGRPSTRLPGVIGDWLRQQVAWAAKGALTAPPTPLVLEREGRRLTIRTVGDASERALLLEESRAGFRPSTLAPLGLTAREAEVLALVAGGRTNEAIAQVLGAKTRTVAKHVERIHRKLGVDNRAAAAARANEISAAGVLPG